MFPHLWCTGSNYGSYNYGNKGLVAIFTGSGVVDGHDSDWWSDHEKYQIMSDLKLMSEKSLEYMIYDDNFNGEFYWFHKVQSYLSTAQWAAQSYLKQHYWEQGSLFFVILIYLYWLNTVHSQIEPLKLTLKCNSSRFSFAWFYMKTQ